jgi:hypothetical protein
MPAFRDLTRMSFGRLTVLGRAPNNKRGVVCRHCVCVDGTKKEIPGSDLTSGHTQSCGCWKLELATQRLTKHGYARKGARSPGYVTYCSILGRCCNTNRKDYPRYGGGGITVCNRWRYGENGLSGFECFYADHAGARRLQPAERARALSNAFSRKRAKLSALLPMLSQSSPSRSRRLLTASDTEPSLLLRRSA